MEPMSTVAGSSANSQSSHSPRAFLIVTSIIALALSTLPYFIGYVGRRSGVYLWAGTSPSDYAVYLAWIRAAADGSLRDPHLFAGGHPGMLINPIYWLMGLIVKQTGLSGAAVYHGARVIFGALLLYTLWRFVRLCTPDPLTRRLAFLFLCFSSGFGWCLGWLPLKYWSIDLWQPEAFTFLSLYSYPHFCAALALQVATIGLLLKTVTSGRYKYAVAAGVCALTLAIVHTYDVITLVCIWLAYAAAPRSGTVDDSLMRKRAWLAGLIAGALTAPGVAYIYFAMRTDRVFAQRVSEPTMSSPLYTVLIGYGGVLLLAILGIRLANRPVNGLAGVGRVGHPETGVLLPIWAVVNVAVSYFPVLFQRKMLQGEHVALCVLAAVGAAHLLRRKLPSLDWTRLRAAELLLAAFLSIGNVLYLYHDTRDILSGVEQRRYRSTLSTGEVDALAWVRAHTNQNAVIQPVPWRDPATGKDVDDTLALFAPGITGRAVYAGHWAETPDFNNRVDDVFKMAYAADGATAAKKSGIAYLVFSQPSGPNPAVGRLRLVYSNSGASVYAIE